MNELMNAMDAVKRACPVQLLPEVMRLGDEVNRVVNEMAHLRNELAQLRAQVNAGNCPKCGGRMADHFEWEGRMRCPVQNYATRKPMNDPHEPVAQLVRKMREGADPRDTDLDALRAIFPMTVDSFPCLACEPMGITAVGEFMEAGLPRYVILWACTDEYKGPRARSGWVMLPVRPPMPRQAMTVQL